MMPRIRWTEKAKRLAEKYDVEDDIEVAVTHRPIEAFGIENQEGHHIWWNWKDGLIDCEVSLN